jgi:cytochrome c
MAMRTTQLILLMGLGFCSAVSTFGVASAQTPLPVAKPADGATLFKQQCGTCHTLDASEPVRQGPPLAKVIGRPAGKVDGFHYSPALAKADFVWDDTKLDAWLTNPQDVLPGAVMAYRQGKPEIRAAVIAYLKEQK